MATLSKPTISSWSWDEDSDQIIVKWKTNNSLKVNYIFSTNGYTKSSGTVSSTSSTATRTDYLDYDNYNTTYTVDLTISYSGYDSATTSFSITTGTISKWSWTTAEKNAFNNHGLFKTLTAGRWQNLCQKYNKVMNKAKDRGIVTKSLNCLIEGQYFDVESGDALMASDFETIIIQMNSCFTNAGVYYDKPSSSSIKAGKTVYGYYFIDIGDALNDLIDLIVNA